MDRSLIIAKSRLQREAAPREPSCIPRIRLERRMRFAYLS